MALLCLSAPALALQADADRSDPASVEEELRRDRRDLPRSEPAPVLERAAATATIPTGDAILVGAIRIEGATEITPSAFAGVIAAYAGRELSPADLSALASAVADVARRAGFGLATAWVPEQRSGNGVLKVMLDEGRVDSIQVSGAGRDSVQRMLSPLANGRPLLTAELERRLLLAGDIAGVRVGKARLERRDGRNILHVAATRQRMSAQGLVDNWGSDAIGPVRARLTYDLNGVGFSDDRLSLGGLVTPLQPKEFQLLRAAYTKPVGNNGTEISFGGYYAHSRPGAAAAGRDLEGRSLEAEAGARHAFVRTRDKSIWGDVSLRLRDSRQTRIDAAIRDDRLAILSASAFGNFKLSSGKARGRLTFSQGFDALGATRNGDPLASRRDADGVFTKIALWGEVEHRFDRNWSVQLQAEGQIASGPLLSSEEMGLGGRNFLRAYDYRERAGDKGAAVSAELRFDLADVPKPLKSIKLYAFADAGTVSNYGNGSGGGSLASIGAGGRARLSDKVELGLELGLPLADRRDPAERRDPRFSFTLATRF